MRILSITAQKPHSTGSGTYLTELVRAWSRGGHEQAVVCGIYPSDKVDLPDGVACYPVFFTESARCAGNSGRGSASGRSGLACSCKEEGERFTSLPFPVTGMSDIMPYNSTRYRDMTPEMTEEFSKAFIRAAGRAIEDLDPDLIVCHHLFLLTAVVRKNWPGRRVIGISHGTDLRQMINCDNLRDAVRPEIRRLDMILALHAEQKDQIIEIFGADEDRVKVIGSGYNAALFNRDGRESGTFRADSAGRRAPVHISYAGKISRPKGVPELMEAVRLLAADPEVPSICLTLAGGCQDPALMQEFKLYAVPDNYSSSSSAPDRTVSHMNEIISEGSNPSDNCVSDYSECRIRWLGQIPQFRLAELLKKSDIFVLPSYFEGLPLVIIEAMASGAIPVCTDLPGIRGWLDSSVPGSNVIFVPRPEMKTIDEPTPEGRRLFVHDLYYALKQAVLVLTAADNTVPHAGTQAASPEGRRASSTLPDTSGITWDSLAARILSL